MVNQLDLESLSWFFLMMLMISIPANVRWADSNSLNPVLITIRLLMVRWSCSTILFGYLTRLIFIFFSERLRLLIVRIPAVFAPLGRGKQTNIEPRFFCLKIHSMCLATAQPFEYFRRVTSEKPEDPRCWKQIRYKLYISNVIGYDIRSRPLSVTRLCVFHLEQWTYNEQ